ncbi:MAG: ATP-binding protein [Clostridiales bacterium]|nr:ATP-binding protein [Clostridiales bacterium]
MNKIIIVAGYCATGKSTFARKLSQKLSIPCFCKDTLKEAMADGFGVNSELLETKGSAAATNIMLHIAECFLQTGNVCILESNFRAAQGEEIKKLLEKYNALCLTFLFGGNLEVLWDRYAKRAPQRHWVHLGGGDESKDDFIQVHLSAGIGEVAIGRTIAADATDFAKISYAQLFAEAEEFVSSETGNKKAGI